MHRELSRATVVILLLLGWSFGNALHAQCDRIFNSGQITPARNICGGDVGLWRLLAEEDDPTNPVLNPATDNITVQVDWGDGSPIDTYTLTYVAALDFWTVNASHTFPDGTGAHDQCIYNAEARFFLNGGPCDPADISIQEARFRVFDEIDNNSLGRHDIDPDQQDPRTVLVCEGDDSPVNLIDNSTWNCIDEIDDTVNPPYQTGDEAQFRNGLQPDEYRWIQWVYGVNYANANFVTGDNANPVIINGVAYDPSDPTVWPVYGPPQSLGQSVAPPNLPTFDMQMPVTAQLGERFEVTLRSWNFCNKYDEVLGDGVLNPSGTIEIGPVAGQGTFYPASASAPAFTRADEDPIEITGKVLIVDTPPPPVLQDSIICKNSPAPILSAGGSVGNFTWYSDPNLTTQIGTGGTLDTNPHIDTSIPGVTTFYVTQTIDHGGIISCEGPPDSLAVTVVDLPDPSFTWVRDPADSCGSTNIDFTNTSTLELGGPIPPGSNYTYLIDNNAGGGSPEQTVNGESPQNVVLNYYGSGVTASWYVRLRITTPDGCSITSPAQEIRVGEIPNFSLSGPNVACEGSVTNYGLVGGVNSNSDFIVDISRGFVLASGQSIDTLSLSDFPVAIRWNATGLGSVNITEVTIFGCETTETRNVSISPQPMGGFTLDYDDLAINPNQCGVAQISIGSFTGSGNDPSLTNYFIHNPGGGVSNTLNGDLPPNTISLNAIGTWAVRQELESGGSPNCRTNTFIPVDVHSIPQINANVNGANTAEICLGDTVNFSDLTSLAQADQTQDPQGQLINFINSGDYTNPYPGAQGPMETLDIWTWDFDFANPGVNTISGSGAIGADINLPGAVVLAGSSYEDPQVIYLNSGNYDVNLEVTSAAGCSNDRTFGNMVIVNPLPTASAGPDGITCPSDPITIGGSPTGSGTTAPYTYVWDNAGLLSDNTVGNPDAVITTPTTFTVEVTDGNGCVNTDDIFIDFDPNAPNGQATVNPPGGICGTGTSVTFGHDNTNIDPGQTVIEVYRPNGTLAATSPLGSNSFNYTLDQIGTWTGRVYVESNVGVCTAFQFVYVNVLPDPAADANVNGANTAEVCLGELVTFNDLSTLTNPSAVAPGAPLSTLPGYMNPNPSGTQGPNSNLDSLEWDFDLANPGTLRIKGIGAIAGTIDLGGALVSGSYEDPVVEYTSAGTYDVQLRAFSDSSCVGTFQRNAMVIVNPLPPDPTVGYPGQFCANEATGSIAVADPGAPFIVEWFQDATTSTAALGTTSGTRDSIFTPTNPVTATYYAEYVNTNTGCRSLNRLAIDITRNPFPSVDNMTFDANPICDRDSTQMRLEISGTTGPYTVVFRENASPPDTVTGYVSGDGIYITPTNGTLFQVTNTYEILLVRDEITGCRANVLPLNTITVNPSPAVDGINGPTDFCQGASNIYRATFTNPPGNPGNYIYYWYWNDTQTNYIFGGNGSPGTPGNNDLVAMEFPVPLVDTVALMAETAFGCRLEDTLKLGINSQPLPVPFVIEGATDTCAFTTVKYYANPGQPTSSYNWTIPTGASFVYGDTQDTVYVTFSNIGGTISAVEDNGDCVGDPVSTSVNINPLPNVYTVTGGGEYCDNAGAVGLPVDLTDSDNGFNYELEFDDGSGFVVSATLAGNGSGLSFGNQLDSGFYRVRAVNNTTGCNRLMNGDAIIDPEPELLGGDVDGSQAICIIGGPSGNAIDPVPFTESVPATGGSGIYTYQWYSATNINGPYSPIPFATNVLYDAPALAQTTYFVREVISVGGVCPVAYSDTLEVEVRPLSTVTANPLSQVICNLDATNIDFTSVGTDSLDYSVNLPAGLTGASNTTGLPSAFTLADVLNNSTDNALTATYTVIPRGFCDGLSIDVPVTVEPTPVVTAINNDSIICNGGIVDITLNSPTNPTILANLTFDFTVSSTNPGALGGSASGNGTVTTKGGKIHGGIGTLTNSSNDTITVTYTITPLYAGCPSGTPITVDVVVEPTPQLVIANNKPVVCPGDNVTDIDLTTPTQPTDTSDISFELVSIVGPGITGLPTLGTIYLPNEKITDALTNTTSNFVTVTYTLRPRLNGCASGPDQQVSVTVEPTPTITAVNNKPRLCVGDATTDIDLLSNNNFFAPGNLTIEVTDITPGAVTGMSPIGTSFIAGDKIQDVLTNPTDTFITVTYELTARFAGCDDGNTVTVDVIVEPDPVISVVDNKPVLCAGDGTTDLDLLSNTLVSDANDFTIEITAVNAGAVTGASPVGTILNPGDKLQDVLINPTNNFITVSYAFTAILNGCTDGNTVIEEVIVEPSPIIDATNNKPRVCFGDPFSDILLTTSTTTSDSSSIFIEITDITSGAVTGMSPVGTVLDPGDVLADSLVNPTNAFITVTYEFTAKIAGCDDGNTVSVDVIVEPSPQISALNNRPVLCPGDNITDIQVLTSSAVSTPSDLTIELTDVIANGVTGTSPVGTVLNPSAFVNDVLINPGDTAVTVTYEFTARLNGCDNGNVITVDVVVDPSPTIAATNNKPRLCAGDNITDIDLSTITQLNNQTDLTIVLSNTVSGSVTGMSSIGTVFTPGDKVTNNLINPTNSFITVTYEFTARAAGCNDGNTVSVDVIVEPTPVISATNIKPTVCAGDAFTDILLNSSTNLFDNSGFNIELTNVTSGAVTGTSPVGSTFLPGQTVQDSLVNPTNAVLTVTYEFTAKLAGCTDGNIITVDVVVEPSPVISAINNKPRVCAGDNITDILLQTSTTVSSPNDLTILLNNTQAGNVLGMSPVGTVLNPGDRILDVLNNPTDEVDTVTYEFVARLAGCDDGNIISVDVIVEPTPTIAATNNKPRLCVGDATTDIDLSTSTVLAEPSDLTIEITNTIASGVTGMSPIGTTFIPGDKVLDSLVNPTNQAITVTYEFTAKLAGCSDGNTVTVNVVVEPTPNVILANNANPICNGELTNIDILTNTNVSNPIDLTFEISDIDDAGGLVTGMSPVGTSFNAGDNLQDGLTNSSNSFQTVIYEITPILAGCSPGPAQTVRVAVNPTPLVVPSPVTDTLCSQQTTNIVLNSPTIPAQGLSVFMDYTVSVSGGPAAVSGYASPVNGLVAGSTISNTLINNTNVAQIVTYTVTPRFGSCIGNPVDVVIRLEPAPNVLFDNRAPEICDGGDTEIELDSDVANTTFTWTASASDPTVTGFADETNPQPIGSIIAQTIFNPTPASQVVTYTVQPFANGCPGQAQTVQVRVDPTPDISLVSDKGTGPQITVCDNEQVLFSAFGASNYEFYLDGVVQGPFSTNNQFLTSSLLQGSEIYARGRNALGCIGTSDTITVREFGLIEAAISGPDTICLGTTATLQVTLDTTGTGAVAPFTFEYRLSASASVTTVQTSTLVNDIVVQPSPAGDYTYSLISIRDSRSPSCGGVITQPDHLLRVEDAPITATTADVLQGCNPLTVNLVNLSLGDVNGGRWYYTEASNPTVEVDIEIVPSGANSIFTFTNDTNVNKEYFVFYEAFSTQGCRSVSDTLTVTVFPGVESIFTPDATVGCNPFTVTFTNDNVATAIGNPDIEFIWVWGDGTANDTTTTETTIQHVYSNPNTTGNRVYGMSMVARNIATGCQNTSFQNITVYPDINVQLNTNTDLRGCSPFNPQLFSTTTGATNTEVWYWRLQGTTNVNDQTNPSGITRVYNPTLVNTTSDSLVYEIVYSASNLDNCVEDSIIEVVVYPEINAQFDANPKVVTLPNSTISVTNLTTSGDGTDVPPGWIYNWNFGDGTTSNDPNPGPHTYASFGNYQIVLEVGYPVANDTVLACRNVFVQQVTIQPTLPIVDFEVQPENGCAPQQFQLVNLSQFIDVNTIFWEVISEFGQTVFTSNVENPTFTLFEPGTYTIRLEASNPLGILVVEEKEDVIEVYENPRASFQVRPKVVYLPEQKLFTANFSFAADSYIWEFGDGGFSTEFEPEYQYTESGVYDVTLIAQTDQGCSDTLTLEKAVIVEEGNEVKVPNAFTPSSEGPCSAPCIPNNAPGEYNDVFLPIFEGVRDFEMYIFNRWGETLFYSNDKNHGWDGYYKGKLVQQGVYVYRIKLRFENGTTTTKIGDITVIR